MEIKLMHDTEQEHYETEDHLLLYRYADTDKKKICLDIIEYYDGKCHESFVSVNLSDLKKALAYFEE